MKEVLCVLILSLSIVNAGQYDKVRITPEMSHAYVYHRGKAIKVHRIQDTKHKLTGEYVKLYRPGQDIQPIKISKDIQTIGEVELINFMKTHGNDKTGLLIDVREKDEYKKESIPTSVNIPESIKNNNIKIEKILQVLGAKRALDGTLNVDNVLDVVFYCNGLWCNKAPNLIRKFVDIGYPATKIKYYRGGFQMWKILGFTTVTND